MLCISRNLAHTVRELLKTHWRKSLCFYQFHKCQGCKCYFVRQNNYVVRSHLSVSHTNYNTFLNAVRHLFDAFGLHIMKYGWKKANQLFKLCLKINGCEYYKAQEHPTCINGDIHPIALLTFHNYANHHFVISTAWTKCHLKFYCLAIKRLFWQHAKICDATNDMRGNYIPQYMWRMRPLSLISVNINLIILNKYLNNLCTV